MMACVGRIDRNNVRDHDIPHTLMVNIVFVHRERSGCEVQSVLTVIGHSSAYPRGVQVA